MESKTYDRYLQERYDTFEAVCKRCGDCCGANDDPCRNLVRREDGAFFCNDYNNRLGLQKTASGKEFNCIFIREHITNGSLRPNCAYQDLAGKYDT
ncbi:MAG: hypothetical protein WBD04_00490 [Candidatus Omnitrophota bacterium]